MSGFHEILLIIAIVMGVLYLPKLAGKRVRAAETASETPRRKLAMGLRIAIVASVLWPLIALLMVRPWEGDWVRGIGLGFAPILVLWGCIWIAAGTRHKDPHDE